MNPHDTAATQPGGSLVVSLALLLWLLGKASLRFVLWFERHEGNHPTQEEPFVSNPRPRPLRTAASWIGGLLALISGLVGAGVFTAAQGDAATGLINAALTLLATFGVAFAAERKVTPLSDPRDADDRPLIPGNDPDLY
ncbi:hypothetical protein ACQPW3_07995 [Actinosynnema sp. CA-248983]